MSLESSSNQKPHVSRTERFVSDVLPKVEQCATDRRNVAHTKYFKRITTTIKGERIMKYLCEITNKDGSRERKAVSMKELLSIERKRKTVRTLGEICEHRVYGDMCGTWCYHYRKGRCRASTIKDSEGRKWHVWSNV